MTASAAMASAAGTISRFGEPLVRRRCVVQKTQGKRACAPTSATAPRHKGVGKQIGRVHVGGGCDQTWRRAATAEDFAGQQVHADAGREDFQDKDASQGMLIAQAEEVQCFGQVVGCRCVEVEQGIAAAQYKVGYPAWIEPALLDVSVQQGQGAGGADGRLRSRENREPVREHGGERQEGQRQPGVAGRRRTRDGRSVSGRRKRQASRAFAVSMKRSALRVTAPRSRGRSRNVLCPSDAPRGQGKLFARDRLVQPDT